MIESTAPSRRFRTSRTRVHGSRGGAVRPHTGVDLEPQPARHRGGLAGRRREIVEHPPRLPRDVEDVAVSGGGDQGHAPQLSLDDGVGDDGRAEGHHPRVRRLQTQGIESGRDGRSRIVPDAPDLGGPVRPRGPVVCHGVRERAADVDAEMPAHGTRARPLSRTGIPPGPRPVETTPRRTTARTGITTERGRRPSRRPPSVRA